MALANIAVFAAVALLSLALGIPVSNCKGYAPTLVHQFPNNTWIENMAIRKNGEIMATDLDGGRVFLVNPFITQTTPPIVAQFDNHTALTGISEVEDDVFYIQGINNSDVSTFKFPPNSSSVWEIDMRRYASTGKAKVQKVADITKAWLPNGMTTLSKQYGTILIADSINGLIFRLDVNTGIYEIAIDHPVLKNIPGSQTPFGVNGIKVIGNTLYFSSYNQAIVGFFPINVSTGHATGKPYIISSNVTFVDDFAVGPDGSIWAAENVANTFVRVFPNGEIKTVLGGNGSTYLNGPVAAKFGRTQKDKDVLYISTDGQLDNEQGKPLTSNGKIVSINTAHC